MAVNAVRVILLGDYTLQAEVYAYPKLPNQIDRAKAQKIVEDFASQIATRLDVIALQEAAKEEAERMQAKLFEGSEDGKET